MANTYLLQVAYTSETWANFVAEPKSRLDAVRPAIEKLGGTILHGWFAFGDYDLIAVLEMPGNVEAAAFSVAVSAGGALKSIKTTPLLSLEEGLEALKKAGTSGYKAPSQVAHA
jgi:uncharacterized protein with GYD domain